MPETGAVVCIGAAHWDVIARTSAPLAPGADVPGRIARRPGGVALNVALALAGLGQRPVLLSAIGRDAAGDALIEGVSARGVDCDHVIRHEGSTDCYVAIEGSDGGMFAAIADCAGLEAAGGAVLAPLFDGRVAGPGQIVVDGNLPVPVLDRIASGWLEARLAVVPASPGKADRLRAILTAPNATVYLNRLEAEVICGAGFDGSLAAAAALRARGMADVVVTDGSAQVTRSNANLTLSVTPPEVITRSLTGAGDVFLAAHLGAVARGLDPQAALHEAANAAARHISCEGP
jgi:pseudouridine kinase